MDNYAFWSSSASLDRYTKIYSGFCDAESILLSDFTFLCNKNTNELKVLDVGCGGGRTTKVLELMGYQVYAIDISDKLVNSAKVYCKNSKISLGDATSLEFDNEYFDLVLFSHNGIDCIWPKEGRKKCIEEISRVLKPEGFFIFSSHTALAIPFNFHTSLNLIRNSFSFMKAFVNGTYFSEKFENGTKVNLYYSTSYLIHKELKKFNFNIIRYIKSQNLTHSAVNNFLKYLIGSEVYYLTKKNASNYYVKN